MAPISIAHGAGKEVDVQESQAADVEDILKQMDGLCARIFLTTKHMIEFGILAEKIKAMVPHGKFEALMTERFPGVSLSTLGNWRKLASVAAENPSLGDLEPVEAMREAGILPKEQGAGKARSKAKAGKTRETKAVDEDTVAEQAKLLAQALCELPESACENPEFFAALRELQQAIDKFTRDSNTEIIEEVE